MFFIIHAGGIKTPSALQQAMTVIVVLGEVTVDTFSLVGHFSACLIRIKDISRFVK